MTLIPTPETSVSPEDQNTIPRKCWVRFELRTRTRNPHTSHDITMDNFACIVHRLYAEKFNDIHLRFPGFPNSLEVGVREFEGTDCANLAGPDVLGQD